MPRLMVTVNYDKCRPRHCAGGICAAAAACPRNLLRQEAPYEVPLPSPTACPDCAKCVLACTLKAVELK